MENLHGIVEKGKKFESYFEGELLGSSYNFRTAEIMFQKAEGTYVHGRTKIGKKSSVNNLYNIDKRFEFLEKAVEMAASGIQPSIIIAGKGGMGKTYSVNKTLKNCGIIDISGDSDEFIPEFSENYSITFKGFSTAKSFYRTLYNYNGSVIICDDMDSVFKDNTSVSILKAALDSYDKRIIHWGSELRGTDDDLPRTFEFTGKIIFITNLNNDEIDQAIISRSLVIDLSMTNEELVERMQTIINSGKFLSEYSMEIKMDSLNFVDENKEDMKDLSLRTLISICKIRAEFPGDWEDMAKYITCA